MSIYSSTKVRPYVYYCVHNITGHYYFGYRENNIKVNLPSNLDFPLYRTSSIVVKHDFENYSWHIVAEFEFGKDAYDFEQQLIYENWENPLLLNKTCFHGKKRFKAPSGRPLSDETKKKIGDKAAQRIKDHPFTDNHKANLRAAVSKSNKTRSVSEESNQKRSETMKRRRAEKFWTTTSSPQPPANPD